MIKNKINNESKLTEKEKIELRDFENFMRDRGIFEELRAELRESQIEKIINERGVVKKKTDRVEYYCLEGVYAITCEKKSGGFTYCAENNTFYLADFMERGSRVTFNDLPEDFKKVCLQIIKEAKEK